MKPGSTGLYLGVLLTGFGAGANADGDVAALGQDVFEQRCAICHTAEPGGSHKIGPNLFGVMGKPAGWMDSYRYSRAHRESGAVWDEATLDRYLEDVTAVVPKTLKGFSGMRKPEDRAAVIAYLRTLK